MLRKTIVAAITLSLASTSALAAPERAPTSLGGVDGLAGGDESAWMLPAGAIVLAALIILIDGGDDSDFPTSP